MVPFGILLRCMCCRLLLLLVLEESVAILPPLCWPTYGTGDIVVNDDEALERLVSDGEEGFMSRCEQALICFE